MREENNYKIEVHVAGICFYAKKPSVFDITKKRARFFDDNNKILIVKRSSKRKIYPGLWECGGGQVNPGENFREAVKRQLEEELGVVVTPMKILGIYHILTPGLYQKKIPGLKFLCKINSFVNTKKPVISKEHSEFRFISKREIENSKLKFIPGLKEEIIQAFSEISDSKIKASLIHSRDIKEQIFSNKRVKDVLNEKNFPVSIAIVKKTSNDQKMGFDPSTVIYLVLEGKSTTFINGKKYKIEKGDFLILPKETPYKTIGGVTLLAISHPRFDKDKRIYLE